MALSQLRTLEIDAFWEAFDELPPKVAAGGLKVKLGYLRERLEASSEPLM